MIAAGLVVVDCGEWGEAQPDIGVCRQARLANSGALRVRSRKGERRGRDPQRHLVSRE